MKNNLEEAADRLEEIEEQPEIAACVAPEVAPAENTPETEPAEIEHQLEITPEQLAENPQECEQQPESEV